MNLRRNCAAFVQILSRVCRASAGSCRICEARTSHPGGCQAQAVVCRETCSGTSHDRLSPAPMFLSAPSPPTLVLKGRPPPFANGILHKEKLPLPPLPLSAGFTPSPCLPDVIHWGAPLLLVRTWNAKRNTVDPCMDQCWKPQV